MLVNSDANDSEPPLQYWQMTYGTLCYVLFYTLYITKQIE